MFGVVAGVLALIEFLFLEQRERVMIAGMAAKVARAGGFGNKKAQQIEIEAPAGFKVRGVESEVTEAQDFKRTIERYTADVVFTSSIFAII